MSSCHTSALCGSPPKASHTRGVEEVGDAVAVRVDGALLGVGCAIAVRVGRSKGRVAIFGIQASIVIVIGVGVVANPIPIRIAGSIASDTEVAVFAGAIAVCVDRSDGGGRVFGVQAAIVIIVGVGIVARPISVRIARGIVAKT